MRSLAAVNATVVIALGVLIGAGLVVSQLLRLRAYLRNAPPPEVPESPADGKVSDDGDDQ
jgi:hypothetical protein